MLELHRSSDAASATSPVPAQAPDVESLEAAKPLQALSSYARLRGLRMEVGQAGQAGGDPLQNAVVTLARLTRQRQVPHNMNALPLMCNGVLICASPLSSSKLRTHCNVSCAKQDVRCDTCKLGHAAGTRPMHESLGHPDAPQISSWVRAASFPNGALDSTVLYGHRFTSTEFSEAEST